MRNTSVGGSRSQTRGCGEAHAGLAPLLRVCRFLNEAGAQYLIVGAQACILHGLEHSTEDVEILIESREANCQRVIAGLAKLEDEAAAQLTPQDLIENVVVKAADEVEVDVSTQAEFRAALPRCCAAQTLIHGYG